VAPYLVLALFLLGVWGMVRKDNLIGKVIGLSIVNSALVILFVWLGSLSGSAAPILVEKAAEVVDPLPQALMLTAIVIGVCLTALALVLVVRIYRSFGTLDIRRVERQMREGGSDGGGEAGGDGGGGSDGTLGGDARQ
jgi:multicomponent Na+:H+ antiporter subunit C